MKIKVANLRELSEAVAEAISEMDSSGGAPKKKCCCKECDPVEFKRREMLIVESLRAVPFEVVAKFIIEAHAFYDYLKDHARTIQQPYLFWRLFESSNMELEDVMRKMPTAGLVDQLASNHSKEEMQ